jgi:hypothetical protein
VGGAAPCDAIDVCPRSSAASEAAYAALLGALQANPGASTAALSRILNVGKGSIVARCARLARRGALAKRADGHWRVAAEPRWIERPEPERGDRPFPPWVRPVDDYIRADTREFACTRYG